MYIGDIVKIVDWKGSEPDSRKTGKVLRIDGRHPWAEKKKIARDCALAEVMWQDGYVGWVAANRLEKSNI